METVLSIMVGLGLSAACGFRVFVPLLVAGIAARTGHLELASGFSWMGSDLALLAFGLATALEIGGYYIPWLDHALDTLSSPAAVVAGTLMTASVITDMDPFLKWTLSLIAGGGIAGFIQGTTVTTRAVSTASTAGLANPIIATGELGGAIGTSVLALIAPFLMITLLLAGITAVLVLWFRRRPLALPAMGSDLNS